MIKQLIVSSLFRDNNSDSTLELVRRIKRSRLPKRDIKIGEFQHFEHPPYAHKPSW